MHAFLNNYVKYRINGAGHRDDANIYEYRAMRCLPNPRNHKNAYLGCCVIRAVFALYPGLFPEGISAIIYAD
jgi:hypothetical protein